MGNISLNMSLEDFIMIFGGENLRVIRKATEEEKSIPRSDRLKAPVWMGYIECHLEAEEMVREITNLFAAPEVNYKDYHIYFMAMKDLIGGGYWKHPDYSSYGLVITNDENDAKTLFDTSDEPTMIRLRNQGRCIPVPVIIGELNITDAIRDVYGRAADNIFKMIYKEDNKDA